MKNQYKIFKNTDDGLVPVGEALGDETDALDCFYEILEASTNPDDRYCLNQIHTNGTRTFIMQKTLNQWNKELQDLKNK